MGILLYLNDLQHVLNPTYKSSVKFSIGCRPGATGVIAQKAFVPPPVFRTNFRSRIDKPNYFEEQMFFVHITILFWLINRLL